QCNERLRQWLSLPLGIRTCFASFANPWRSSRLSSSLPQSSQRTSPRTQSQTTHHCFASFANPWRSSRLSSSLPQSSQRTSPRAQSQTHAPSETEPLLEPLLTLAAAGQASLRSLTLKEHGRSSIVLHQTVYPHKK